VDRYGTFRWVLSACRCPPSFYSYKYPFTKVSFQALPPRAITNYLQLADVVSQTTPNGYISSLISFHHSTSRARCYLVSWSRQHSSHPLLGNFTSTLAVSVPNRVYSCCPSTILSQHYQHTIIAKRSDVVDLSTWVRPV
jgi:hypothetical protein